jgi:hypothetical protein
LQRIASYQLKTDSGGIETDSKDPFEFKAEYQQQSVAGKPVKTIDAAAEVAEEICRTKIRNTIKNVAFI